MSSKRLTQHPKPRALLTPPPPRDLHLSVAAPTHPFVAVEERRFAAPRVPSFAEVIDAEEIEEEGRVVGFGVEPTEDDSAAQRKLRSTLRPAPLSVVVYGSDAIVRTG